ncbi:Dihydrofolate reductase [Chitinophaga jiangningensis]|uniref:Dihydrofolate reductase n=1 Tax=Chitinophaga jiangningensis TaxID=1419482 RepID=A0A1M7BU38_9BACT|nr:dihydrofolate reductase family protein [Chitinophaga jiangningensis]SHL58511.1 Dihydrofolate reductase [Chitinophaga jiangningensis]
MRKVVALAFVTLDGFTTGPNGETDWQLHNFNEEMGEFIFESYEDADLLLLGRYTYQQFAAYWHHQYNKNPEAARMNNTHKIVFSTTLTEATWHNTRLIASNITQEVNALKRQRGKNIAIVGSTGLIQSFTNLGLIDEYRLLIYPVLLGKGRRLLHNIQDTQQLTFIRSRIFSNGVMLAVYQPVKQACIFNILSAAL